MNKNFILFYLCLSSTCLFSQDTIFTNTSEVLIVRVLEISKVDVTYKNFYNPDGVIRKLNNEQIVRIVYENGKQESKFQLKQKTAGITSPLTLFVIEGKHIALNNIDITHKEAFKMMLKKDPQTNSDELNEYLVKADSKKNGQIAFNILAPTSVLAGIYLARQHRYNDPIERMKARTYFLSGLSVCAVSIIAAQIYKSVKNKHIRKAALLYNSEIL
jgi:hypothetical protein